VQALDGRLEVVAPDEIIPFRNEVTQWATLMTEGHTTVHASTGLTVQNIRVTGFVNFFPVEKANGDRTTSRNFTLRRG
jgi:hypothetical protein